MKTSRILLLACLTLSTSLAYAQDEKKKTHEVKPGFFQVVEDVSAIVESRSNTALRPDTKNWSDLTVERIEPEGKMVAKGDPIVWFNTEEIDKKITSSQQALSLARLSLDTTKLEFEQLSKTFELDQQLAERKHRNLEQDFKYFNDVSKPNREKSAQRSVENSQYSLEYATEELNQLSRMYKEDELTEESEEIVLKRAQRGVENSQFYLEQAQIRAAKTIDVDLPRELEQKAEELERSRLEFELAKVKLPIEKEKKQINFEKAKFELEKQLDEFNKLQADRERMVITAPVSGILYYGRCVRGNWVSSQGGASRDLEKGKKIAKDKVLVTIVDAGDLLLRADLTEEQLSSIKQGSKAKAIPGAMPNRNSTANVDRVSYIPISKGKYDCQMSLDEPLEGLMPGMTCNVRFVISQIDNAISVPESAVFTDDGVEHYVFVQGSQEGDPATRQTVAVGLKSDKKVEIKEGLSAGQKVLLARPE